MCRPPSVPPLCAGEQKRDGDRDSCVLLLWCCCGLTSPSSEKTQGRITSEHKEADGSKRSYASLHTLRVWQVPYLWHGCDLLGEEHGLDLFAYSQLPHMGTPWYPYSTFGLEILDQVQQPPSVST